MSAQPTYDVVVVGGGAAGLSGALVLGRARRRVCVVDAGAARNGPAAHMQGFLSRDGMSPADLLAAGRAEVAGYGVELVDDQAAGIEVGFVVRLAGGRVCLAPTQDPPRVQWSRGSTDGSAHTVAQRAASRWSVPRRKTRCRIRRAFSRGRPENRGIFVSLSKARTPMLGAVAADARR